MKKFLIPLLSSFLFACSDEVSLDSAAGDPSEVLGDLGKLSASGSFFVQKLYPLMKSESGTGCALSACHGTSSSSPETFFQVQKTDAVYSNNWAAARRVQVTEGDFADESSLLLIDRMEDEHPSPTQGFGNWSNDQKQLLRDWAELDN